MRRWSWHRTRVLLLALLVGVGMSLSFSHPSAMSVKMTLAAEMADSGSDGCHGCDGDGGADMVRCPSLCASPAQGLLPGEPADLPLATPAGCQIAHLLVTGHTSSPDPGPPKLLILG